MAGGLHRKLSENENSAERKDMAKNNEENIRN